MRNRFGLVGKGTRHAPGRVSTDRLQIRKLKLRSALFRAHSWPGVDVPGVGVELGTVLASACFRQSSAARHSVLLCPSNKRE